jgi:hypothetical protein
LNESYGAPLQAAKQTKRKKEKKQQTSEKAREASSQLAGTRERNPERVVRSRRAGNVLEV